MYIRGMNLKVAFVVSFLMAVDTKNESPSLPSPNPKFSLQLHSGYCTIMGIMFELISIRILVVI